MDRSNLKIGLALSGGGIRAAVFHLGILKFMAEQNMLEKITFISTVSGASLAIGLIFSINNNTWPTSYQYLNDVLPKIKKILTSKDLQFRAIFKLILQPWHMNNRANVIADTISECWGISGKVKNLPHEPRWIINATTYETGKSWRFMNKRMGDYVCGYVINPDIPISAAMASSAGLPVLIGPYELDTKNYKWVEFSDLNSEKVPSFNKVHLWDGGVYENLGVEALLKQGKFREGMNYLIVSDASGSVDPEKRDYFFAHKRLLRLINIAVDQVRSLRARQIMDLFLKNPGIGLYLKIGNTTEYITGQANIPSDEAKRYVSCCMQSDNVKKVRNYKTTLRKLSSYDFDMIIQHGYEVIKYTQACYER